jgi:predicted MFS family arabinose efflux permease
VSSAPPSDRSAGRAIALLALASFAAQSMVRVSDSLLPQIASDLDVSVGVASIAVTAYALAHGSVQFVMGPIGDRFGKYLCIACATAVATLLTFLCGLAQSLSQLVVARLACGLAAGWVVPLALAYVGDVIPYVRRQPVLGRFLSGQILGQLFGQAAGGVLGDLFGWRRVFFLLAGMFAVTSIALFMELLRNPTTRVSRAAGEPRQRFIEGYATLLKSRFARLIILFAFCEAALLFGAFAYVGADLHLRFGLGFSLVGLFVGCFALGGLIYSFSVVILVNRLGQLGLATLGGVVIASAFTLLALEPFWWLTPIATTGIGLGYYMLHNTLQTHATQMAPQARGTAVSVFSALLYLGQTLGVATAALVFDRYGGVPVFLAAGALMLVFAFWVRRELAAHQAQQHSMV